MNEKTNNNISRFSIDQRLATIKRNKRSGDYLMVIITLSSLIFFGIFIIRPSIVLILELNQKSKDYKSLSRTLDEKIKNLEQIQSYNKEAKNNLKLLNIAITDSSNESDILNNINYVATKNNIQISDVNFTFNDETPTIEAKFNAIGKYENTISMFDEMDNLLTPFNINYVELKPESEYGKDIIKLAVKGESYYLSK